jgi:hypothetical protein
LTNAGAMFQIKIGKKTFNVPENWQECTPDQVRTFLMVRRVPLEKRVRAVMEGLVQAYLGMTEAEWKLLILGIPQWKELKTLASWIFAQGLDGKPFDYFDFEGVRYYLPEPNFLNTTALELSMCNMLFLDFAHPTTPDLTALDKLIATLCRPERPDFDIFKNSPDYDADIRTPYNQARALAVAKDFARLDVATKVAILSYFESMNTDFLEEYATLFGDSKEEPRYNDGTGWLMILKNVAKQNIWGNFDNVCRQPARTVWAFMLDDVLDARAEAAELEKQKEQNDANRNY